MKFNQYMQKKDSAIINESQDSQLITESAEGLLTFFKDMKSYAAMMSQYPALYKEEKEAGLNQVVQLAKFDENAAERGAQMKEKAKEALDAKISALPREKRAQAREQMKERLTQTNEKIDEQIKNKRTALENRLKQVVKDIQTDKADLEKDNPIESTYLSKSVDTMQIETQLDMDELYADKELEAKFAITEITDEKQEKMRKTAKENAAKEAANKKARLSDLEKEAAEAEAELDKKMAGKEEKARETLEAMKSIQGDFKKFLTLGKDLQAAKNESTNFDDFFNSLSEEILRTINSDINEEDDKGGDAKLKQQKEEFTEVRKNITAKIDKLSPSKIAKALDASNEDGEEIFSGIKDQWEEIKTQYKDLRDEVNASDELDGIGDEEGSKEAPKEAPKEPTDDGKKEAIKSKIDAKKEELSKAQTDEKPQAEIDKLIDDLNALKKDLSDLGESVEYIDTFLKEFNSSTKVSTAPDTKIMKFSDFLASRSN